MSDSNDTTARDVIEVCRNRWIAAINAGDADDFVAVLTDDAVWLPVGQPAIRGKEQIRDWLLEPFAIFDYEYSVSDIHVRVAGEWAVERAHFRTRATRREGGDMPIHEGAYTILWRRTPNGWRIERYIDHTEEDAS